jgi:ankyrin repeat protein
MKRSVLAICCVIAWVVALVAPVFGEASKESLASLIQAGNHKEALARIRAGADVNEAQPDGTRPIHWAVYHLDYELLGALLAKKANVNVANEFGSTPIAEAANLGDARW